MNLLKELAVTMMYINIFVHLANEKILLPIIFLLFLGISYLKLHKRNKKYKQYTKKCLIIQREYFKNTLSHDLRIPVIAQIRALDIIKEGKIGVLNQSQKEMIIQIQDSCKCLLNLISLMINTYNIENEKYKQVYEKFNLTDIIIQCINELQSKAKEKNVTFEFENCNDNLNITADKNDLKNVIINILSAYISNAFQGQKLLIKIGKLNNKIMISVNSENKYFTDIFDSSPYNSVGENIRMKFCKKIIENHNGKIIKNDLKNTFSVELPIT